MDVEKAINVYTLRTSYYVEYALGGPTNILDAFIDHSGNMVVVNEYDMQQEGYLWKTLQPLQKAHQFNWRNQTFTAKAVDLFHKVYERLPENSYNTSARNMLDE